VTANDAIVDQQRRLSALADRYGVDGAELIRALRGAGFFLDFEPAEDKDHIDTKEVRRRIAALLDLLYHDPTHLRLIRCLADHRCETGPDGTATPEIIDDEKAVGGAVDDLDRMMGLLHELREAVRPRRGRPPEYYLPLIYGVMASAWRRAHGDEGFTSGWGKRSEPAPTSPAAHFLCDAVEIIDPGRPKLAAELRYLMQADVQRLPGRRQGRRLR
jgi:hypothetical protein